MEKKKKKRKSTKTQCYQCKCNLILLGNMRIMPCYACARFYAPPDSKASKREQSTKNIKVDTGVPLLRYLFHQHTDAFDWTLRSVEKQDCRV
ncbi:hypothetical protein BX600DRAFT_37679 [Xylariales sp. PMI_506]|nr:hypothetical protein BX600DRAFT_37679 [Xylariales sp. PMI_506]